jgi:uncharacterized membrane protein
LLPDKNALAGLHAVTKAHHDLFESRRLESLSNTIFGVAMTLLAYGLPQAAHFDTAPDWTDLYHTYGARLVGMAMSFIIAGVFWFSHQRRLARQPLLGRWAVMLNLLFLLSIILLPVTNGLYGNYGMSGVVAVLYGLHLTVIAGLNAILWRIVTGPGLHPSLAGAVFPLLVFIPGTVVAAFAPRYAIYCWLLAFGGLLVSRLASRGDDTVTTAEESSPEGRS